MLTQEDDLVYKLFIYSYILQDYKTSYNLIISFVFYDNEIQDLVYLY